MRCTDCGACVDHCLFHARTMAEGALHLDRTRCYGCGLCVPACPTAANRMVARAVTA